MNSRFSRHFSRQTLRGLESRGIVILGLTNVPGADGSFANGQTAYRLDNNGTHQMRTHAEVIEIAAS